MNKKFLNLITKITAMVAILILCSCGTASAFSFGGSKSTGNSFISNILNKLTNKNQNKEYDLSALKIDLEKMKKTDNIDINQISGLISKLPNEDDKMSLNAITELFSKIENKDGNADKTSLITKLIDAIKSLLGNSKSSGLPVNPVSIEMTAKTAAEFAGNDYAVKLHANVYKHVNENGQEDSDKWVVLIHPFMLKGQAIAKAVGPYYYEKGYNIIAPDLRSFGDSDGKVALGCLESLDVYDWLNLINEKYDVKQVIVHGISLGGATTNFLSGIDGFMNNGPTKLSTPIKSIKELKVVALVEDCGYVDMTDFAKKNMLLKMNIGLTEENFDYYSKATNSLKYCDLPMLIIHGTKDTTVKPENATRVQAAKAGGYTEYWSVDGAPHAFVIVGSKKDEYKEHVQAYIDRVEAGNTPETAKPTTSTTGGNTESSNSFFQKILEKLKGLKK